MTGNIGTKLWSQYENNCCPDYNLLLKQNYCKPLNWIVNTKVIIIILVLTFQTVN